MSFHAIDYITGGSDPDGYPSSRRDEWDASGPMGPCLWVVLALVCLGIAVLGGFSHG